MQSRSVLPFHWTLAACAAAALAACGGGSGTPTADVATAADASGSEVATSLSIDSAVLPDSAASLVAQPTFHLAPVVLDAPDDADATDNVATARSEPHTQSVPAALADLPTQRLTLQSIQRTRALAASGANADTAAPKAATSAVSTYTPAQIRAAYGLPALPASGTTPTAAQAAALGAGQTIYIVDAMHDANVGAELAAFNQKFGLPACTVKAIAPTAALPLGSAGSTDGCVLSVIYSNTSAAMTATAPAADAGWATEITLDVQWAHATAPLARIVLIEAPDASLNSLLGAVKLANAMGPGVVSMIFGSTEGNWTSSVDGAFTSAGMTYLAATGDAGSQVSWPAVSPNVLAVGGTSLTYSGTAARTESTWALTGGGISAYTATPAYQSNTVPGVGTLAHRSVADVSFNANPNTGQFVALIPQGSSAVSWVSAGGTSLSTPQWAGLVAVANAVRAQSGKARLGAPHSALYGSIGAVPGTYAAAFGDVTTGNDGTCATCAARSGYDQPTGLGTPNVAGLLTALTGVTATAAAPVVSSASISGKAGTALSFNVSVAAANALTYTLASAPAGMAISTAGTVSWAKPVAGTYAVTVTAKDSKTGLSGQGVYTVKIDPAVAAPPVVTAAAMSGVVGKALTGSIAVSSPGGYGLSVSIGGIPAGMTFAVSGQTIVASWAKPTLGKWTLTVVVKDSMGQSTQISVPVSIAAK